MQFYGYLKVKWKKLEKSKKTFRQFIKKQGDLFVQVCQKRGKSLKIGRKKGIDKFRISWHNFQNKGNTAKET